MNVGLELRVETERLERVRVAVLVAPFFASDRPLRGPAARADWRLCGLVSAQLQRGRLRGAPGEALLVPSAGRLAAPVLLCVGLGSRDSFDEAAFRALSADALARAWGLAAGRVGFAIPAEPVLGLETPRAAAVWLEGAVEALAARATTQPVTLLVPPGDLGEVRAALARVAHRLGAPGPGIRISSGSSAERPSQRASRPPGPVSSPGFSPVPRS